MDRGFSVSPVASDLMESVHESHCNWSAVFRVSHVLKMPRFDNRLVAELPGDPLLDQHSRLVNHSVWSAVQPSPVSAPQLLAVAPQAAALLDMHPHDTHSPEFAQVFAGNRLLAGMQPFATNYGGHQFGQWAGQLGDGRAISLGEAINAKGERWEIQLKGAGPTPYSRHADGRAVLRSSLREFLCSEAMYHLGIPTTRALSLVLTGDEVEHDMFYDGHPVMEPGAILCRLAPSFIRFGHFQLPAMRQDNALLRQLMDFTLARDFPEMAAHGATDRYADWFMEICQRTARLMVDWMRVGFVHGVMNTDNMSILGLTLDYGPYGWMESLDPAWTPNTTDAQQRRYCFANQPAMARWNLERLAESLLPVVEDREALLAGLHSYQQRYSVDMLRAYAEKFGFSTVNQSIEELMDRAFKLMHDAEVDMTLFFRSLAQLDPDDPQLAVLAESFYSEALLQAHHESWSVWLRDYAAARRHQQTPRAIVKAQMDQVNPCFVLRNWLVQQAVDALAEDDHTPLHALMQALRDPWHHLPGLSHLYAKRPDWARDRPGCSMLSCSS